MKEAKKEKKLTAKEKKNLKIEVLEKISTLATAGFGLVAALAWNDAIKKLFSEIFPKPGGNILALFIYAVVITVVVVIITVYLGRLINLVKRVSPRHQNFGVRIKKKLSKNRDR